MGGGLMQLVAYGAQDIYLTGNPQITFFKVVYRRHTNFSMESIQQTFSGQATSNGDPVCTISRNGDLVHKIYLVQTIDNNDTKSNITNPENIIKNVDLEIGGQLIDRQSIEWMNTWNELSTPFSKSAGLKCMQGLNSKEPANRVHNIRIPLLFWFCRHPGLALPLIALQYHEVVIKLKMGEYGTSDPGFNLYCDYIYLDTDERRRFAQVSHEYLIEQIQEQTIQDNNNTLYFNHPVKELIWSTKNHVGNVQFKLNGHDRFSEREYEYFELQQPYDYHTSIPNMNLPDRHSGGVVYELLSSETTALDPPVESLMGQNNVNIPLLLTDNDMNYKYYLVFISSQYNSATGINNFNTDPLPPSAFAWDIDEANQNGQYSDEAQYHGLLMNSVTASHLNLSASNVGKTFRFTYNQGSVNYKYGTLTTTLKGFRRGGGTDGSDPDHGTDYKIDPSLYLATFSEFGIFYNPEENTYTYSSTFKRGIQIINIEEVVVHPAVASSNTSMSPNNIGVYSFALKPEEHQPSGTCNFSRIDNAELIFPDQKPEGKIFAVNYNVLRIMSGMGGLAYSN